MEMDGEGGAMRTRREWIVVLAVGVGVLAVFLLLAELGAPRARAQDWVNPWPLTADGRSRFAGWSLDGRTVLVNRWGAMVGDGTSCQTLSELWATDVQADLDLATGAAVKLSGNAVRPAYADGGSRLAILAFAGDDRWEVRTLELGHGYKPGDEQVWASADWRMAPAWIDGQVAFMRDGRLWLSREGAAASPVDLPALPEGARVGLSGAGTRVAWSDGARLWVSSPQWERPRLLVSPRPQPGLESGERETAARVLGFAWSPDGRRLAYVVAGSDLSPALWAADVARGEEPRLLVQGDMETFSAPSWSPDGRQLAFSRAPLGSGTALASDIWLVGADGSNPRPLLHNDLEESSPTWSPDGHHLAFNRAGDVWILDLFTNLRIYESTNSQDRESTRSPILHSPAVQHTPPLTIRVIHREENFYRDVPVGQIDVITFENYVKRCVPVEMPALWPLEAVKVQAVAARTYAWFHTLARAGEDWDVSDWTDFQVMGSEDERHPRSDTATDATQGQYVAYQGDVIQAFYSARNGSPTRSAAGYDYIQAVDDPVSFWDERLGHGWGMSQWGARRWAEGHGWGYQQILAHYYTGVTIELPSTGGPTPIGGIVLPWSDFFVTGNRVGIVANASDEAGDVTAVGFYVTGVATNGAALVGVEAPALAGMETRPTLLVTDTVGADGWRTVWNVSALSDTTTARAITLSLLVADGAGNVQTQTQAVYVGLDRRPPTSITAAFQGIYTDVVTVTLSSLSAVDPGLGSGVQEMAFSNEGWAWEGEALSYLTSTAEVVSDTDALNGWALRGLSATHSGGIWRVPYTHTGVLPSGRAYRAYFRLKTNGVTTTTELATLEVMDDGGARLLGIRRLRGIDFRTAGVYQEFPVDFHYGGTGETDPELRTTFRAAADLYLDRVLVVSYPVAYAGSAQWQLTPGEGLKMVTVKFIDGAGNVSADVTTTITLRVDTSPPTGWQDFAPEQWDGGPPPTCTVRVFDAGSGLNVDSARYRFSTDGGGTWSDWFTATCTGISGTTEVQTVTAAAVPFDLPRTGLNQVQFRIADVGGLTSTSTYIVRGPLGIDGPATGAVGAPYTFTASINPLTGTVVAPITYTWQATEQARVVNSGEGVDRAVFTWTTPGPKTVVVTATNAEGTIASAAHTVVIEWYVYLSVGGPMAGGVGTPYTFTAAISSITGTVEPPFTYTWQATEQARIIHESGSVDRAVFTWITAGFQAVAVTATNAGGYAGSAVHTIEIGARIYLPLVLRD
jgi:hypothetical protein